MKKLILILELNDNLESNLKEIADAVQVDDDLIGENSDGSLFEYQVIEDDEPVSLQDFVHSVNA